MEAQRILTASVLDIVFDGRNKEYGAYVLRKEYNKHLITALIITGVFILLLSIYFRFGPTQEVSEIKSKPPIILEVSPPAKPPKIEQPKPISHPPAQQPRIRTVRNMTPVIVKDATKEEMPPENATLENAKIGNINVDGPADDIVGPPQGSSNGVIGAVERHEDDSNRIFIRVEIESTYPGGLEAWKRFLLKTVRYPAEAEDRIEGTVIIQFVVDTEGVVSDVEAISGPDELKNEAIRVIKKSGKWTPAIQNGRKVKSYKKQPITFRITTD